MANAYLFKHFNFISAYNDIFSNLSSYKCLCNNAFKHFKIMHQRFLKYASQPRLEISVSMDISVLAFYGYIGYIGDISVDIFL